MAIDLTVNGRQVTVDTDATTPLLDVLRNHLDLKGSRYGCGLEQCGACMVLLDGEPDYSCARETGAVAGTCHHHDRGPGHAGTSPSAAARVPAGAGRPVRLLPVRHHHQRQGVARPQSRSVPRRNREPRWTSTSAAAARIPGSSPPSRKPPGGSTGMSDTLPLSILNNRRLEKWLRFQPDRTVRLAVGKVEIGQGVLIALSQIAAEELDVAIDRIDILSGDTADAPDEGSTSSSQSIEVSGRSVRLVSAELRTRVLGRLAQRLNCAAEDLSVEDGAFLQDGNPTGHDYWSFSGPEDFAADIEGSARPKPTIRL